jgi:uncharacterized protein YbaP (TraB family)
MLYSAYKKANKPTGGLETLEKCVVNQVPHLTGEQQRALYKNFHLSSLHTILSIIVQYDIDENERQKLYQLIFEEQSESSSNMISDIKQTIMSKSPFVCNRNKAWLPTITDTMQDIPRLFLVGALHLPSRQGLLKMLLDKEYTIYRIDKDGTKTAVTSDNYSDAFVIESPVVMFSKVLSMLFIFSRIKNYFIKK